MAEHGDFEGEAFVVEGAAGRLKLIQTKLDEDQPLVICTPEGQVTVNELIAFCERLISSPQFDTQVSTLWDFRGFDFGDYDLAECRSQAQFLQRFPARRGAKRACLVDNALAYGHARMFQEVVSGFKLDDLDKFFVSYSLDECLAWLAE